MNKDFETGMLKTLIVPGITSNKKPFLLSNNKLLLRVNFQFLSCSNVFRHKIKSKFCSNLKSKKLLTISTPSPGSSSMPI